MAEWRTETGGAGGPALEPQIWDLDAGTVRLGDHKQALSPDDPDFELVRAAYDPHGRPFPGEFLYSPIDGARLTPPRKSIVRCGDDGLPEASAQAHDPFAQQPIERKLPTTSGSAYGVHVGSPRIGLFCDPFLGALYRWSPKLQEWRYIAQIKPVDGSRSLCFPASTERGLVYAGSGSIVNIVRPGLATLQKQWALDEGARPIGPPVALADGSAVVPVRSGEGLRLALLKQDASKWRILGAGNIELGEDVEFGPGRQLPSGDLVWPSPTGHVRAALEEKRITHIAWPDRFEPLLSAGLRPGIDGLYQLGVVERVPWWALIADGDEPPRLIEAADPLTPYRGGFIDHAGWRPDPTGEVEPGPSLMQGYVGKPLARIGDETLFLAVRAPAALWADALAMKPRRWQVLLLLAAEERRPRIVFGEAPCQHLDRVQALLLDDEIQLLGLKPGVAIAWNLAEGTGAG